MRKIKILTLCDSPTAATGFAQVARNVLNRLAETGKYHIDVIGINYYGDYYDREKYPYNIYPAMPQGYQDMYGRDRLLSALSGNLEQNGLVPPWDLIFTIQDPFIIEGLGIRFPFGEQLRVTSDMWKRILPQENWFKWIAYWPVDAPIKENWVTRSIALPHYPVAYCDWGKEQILKFDRDEFTVPFNFSVKGGEQKIKGHLKVSNVKDRISVIHHGVDLNTFKPLPKKEINDFRKTYFGGKVKNNTFLVTNISRNQPRKDISRTLKAFSLFKKKVPNSYLYLHMKEEDAGGSVVEMANQFGLKRIEDYTTPKDFSANSGFTIDIVNKIYNASDLCMTTTLGEGWGFITSEAMATKTAIVAPNITSIIDIFGTKGIDIDIKEFYKNDTVRGIPVKAGTTTSEWICLGIEDNERTRPLTNVDDMVAKMVWAYKNPEEVKKITDRAYEWIQGQTWKKVVDSWQNIFDLAFEDLEKERALAKLYDEAGRNDLCPCGSAKKFKHCHGDSDTKKRFIDLLDEDIEKDDLIPKNSDS